MEKKPYVAHCGYVSDFIYRLVDVCESHIDSQVPYLVAEILEADAMGGERWVEVDDSATETLILHHAILQLLSQAE